MSFPSWFPLAACLFELGMLGMAVLLGGWLDIDPWLTWRWDWVDLVRGMAGAAPPWLVLIWVMNSSWGWMARLREYFDTALRPVFGGWSAWQLALLSACAGLGEEVLIRGLVQAGLAERMGPDWALVLASITFGMMHPISGGYVVLSGLIGLWLGWLWLYTGNLMVPVVAHAVYDFTALRWLLGEKPSIESEEPGAEG